MPRSSELIAALASALAKAQAELVNPEKSLTATIRGGRPGESERSFRYAPLSSGLDIVRKTLGQHEIATIQTTAVDNAAGMVQLTTMLAHTSGEWIASDWPVCPVSETANPQRMGAALTYARRYALFTLVGIAGEDDLDAPELNAAPSGPDTSGTVRSSGQAAKKPYPGNGKAAAVPQRRSLVLPHQSILPADGLAKLRDAMLAEIGGVASSTAAAAWANAMLPSKNTLTTADARSVEAAFETKFADFLATDLIGSEPMPSAPPIGANSAGPDIAGEVHAAETSGSLTDRPFPIAKTVLHRNKEHLRFVRTQPCLVCARQPSDPHHLRFAAPRALGRKVSDEFTVPLCRAHHREVHRTAKELAWWKSPPIINSHDTGKIGEETKEVFIECSGFDFNVLNKCLNMIVTALTDMGGEIFSMELEYPDKKYITPNLEPERMKLDIPYINRCLGLELKEPEMKKLLRKMGMDLKDGEALIPAYRADIMGPVDLVEDVCVAYGFENFIEQIPNVATIGHESKTSVLITRIAHILAGLGLLELNTYNLTNKENQNDKTLSEGGLAELESSVSKDYTHLRRWMLPIMLEVFQSNKHNEYPQKIFDAGTVFLLDPSTEMGVAEKTRLCVAVSEGAANYTMIRQVLDYLFVSLGIDKVEIKELEHPSFIPGRVGKILVDGREIGYIGEVHPQVLSNFQLDMPVGAFEIDLDAIKGIVR